MRPADGTAAAPVTVRVWFALRVADRTRVLDAARSALADAGFAVVAR